MIRKISILLLTVGLTLTYTAAQNREISFHKNEQWKDVVEEARRTNKIIFMDCYTDWCGPCKMLDRDVFTNDQIADYYNEHFVNAKYDMEKGEGITLKDKYGISAFPTLLFIDPRTEQVIHRVAGAGNVEYNLEQARIAVDPASNLQGLKEKYEASEKTAEDLSTYLAALRRAAMNAEMNRVTIEYMNGLSDEQIMQEENWSLLESNVNDPLSEPLQRVFANREAFSRAVGEERVERLLTGSMMVAVNRFRNKDPEPAENFDQERYDALISFMSQLNDESAKTNLRQLQTIGYAQQQDYSKMIGMLREVAKDEGMVPQMKSVFLMTHLTKLIGRDAVKDEALEFVDEIIAETSDNHQKGSFYLIKGMMLESYGDQAAAEEAREEADRYRKMGGTPQMMRIG